MSNPQSIVENPHKIIMDISNVRLPFKNQLSVVFVISKIILQLHYILYYNLNVLYKTVTDKPICCYIICDHNTHNFVCSTVEEHKKNTQFSNLPEITVLLIENLPPTITDIISFVNTYSGFIPLSEQMLYLSVTCLLHFNRSEYQEIMDIIKQKTAYSFFSSTRFSYIWFRYENTQNPMILEQYSSVCEDLYENEEICNMLIRKHKMV